MESPPFAKNQIVFARIRGYPCWPGKIHEISTTSKVTHYIVFLYGFDRLMRFKAGDLHDYGGYIEKNTNKICDLLLYVRAIEDARDDFRFSQNQSSQKGESPIIDATKNLKTPSEEVFDVENEESYLPLLRSLVEKKQIAEDPEYLKSQSCGGDLRELQAEINLLVYDYHIKSCASLKKVNLKKCLTYLSKLRKLQLTQFVLSRNPQILQTLRLLRRYTGDSRKWKLSSKDRVNFVHFTQKVRKLASVILRSFKDILGNLNESCSKNPIKNL